MRSVNYLAILRDSMGLESSNVICGIDIMDHFPYLNSFFMKISAPTITCTNISGVNNIG